MKLKVELVGVFWCVFFKVRVLFLEGVANLCYKLQEFTLCASCMGVFYLTVDYFFIQIFNSASTFSTCPQC